MAKVHMSSGASNVWVGCSYTPLLVDQVRVMLKKESDFYCCVDYLENQVTINENWRQKGAEWCFKVIDFYDLDRDIVNVAMSYIDRVLSNSSDHPDRRQCELALVAALKIAVKLYEPRALNMTDMQKLARKMGCSFEASDIILMENEVLWQLNWDVHPATVFSFSHYLTCMLPDGVGQLTRYIIQELSKYCAELAICVYSFSLFKPSQKAIACICFALDQLGRDAPSPEDRNTFFDRVFSCCGLSPHGEPIRTLTKEMKDLVCHNTDVVEFVRLIRASNRPEFESPRTVQVKTLEDCK